ncbi:MAG: glycosyltransferase family 4 protein [Actinomycetota bacterium]
MAGLTVAYDAAPLLTTRTGIGHYAAALLDGLLAADPQIRFELFALTRSPNRPDVPSSPRVSFRHVRIPARLAVASWERTGRPSGELLVGRADVVHGTNFWIPPIRRGNGAVTIHDLTFWIYPELCTAQVQRYRWIVPRVLKRCSIVFTPSQTVRIQVAAEFGFPPDRIVVTREGVRRSFPAAAADPSIARRLGVAGEYVLFAGTQEPRKNLDRLIQAFARVPEDVSLVIAGPPGWGSLDLPAFSHHLGLDRRVVFSGYLPDAELASLMAGARAFAFPSIYEGFGLPALEAMAAGVPVVAGRAGALPEVLGDAPFWCDPLSIDSIAAAVSDAVGDDEARAAAIGAGQQQAARYSWEECARRTLEGYRMVTER